MLKLLMRMNAMGLAANTPRKKSVPNPSVISLPENLEIIVRMLEKHQFKVQCSKFNVNGIPCEGSLITLNLERNHFPLVSDAPTSVVATLSIRICLNETHRDAPQPIEAGLQQISGSDGGGGAKRSGHDDFTRIEAHAELSHRVCEPGDRGKTIQDLDGSIDDLYPI
jgi:hypothetical protein